jgi:hypothetical protein
MCIGFQAHTFPDTENGLAEMTLREIQWFASSVIQYASNTGVSECGYSLSGMRCAQSGLSFTE